MSNQKSKWFVVATEGATTDEREIKREWLTQIAKNYDLKKYGARINLEHFRWRFFDPKDAHSYSYGDVLAVKTEENAEGKLQLLAQIEPTDGLVKMVRAKQKVYTSVEIDLNFADTGEAYLVGLAVTDSPASLGTEYLNFCANAQHSPLADRKQKPENLVCEAVEFTEAMLETTEKSFLEKFTALFSKAKTDNDGKFTEHEQALTMLAEKFNGLENQLQTALADNHQLKADLEKLSQQAVGFAEKFTQLENEESKHYTARPAHTGNNGEQLADY